MLVEIVTPEAALWQGSAQALMARSSDGEFTVLPQHTSLVTDVVPGVVRVATSEGEQSFCVHGGYVQVGPGEEPGTTRTTLLAGVAERVSEIDGAQAQADKERLEAELAQLGRDGGEDPVARSVLETELARAELRLRAIGR